MDMQGRLQISYSWTGDRTPVRLGNSPTNDMKPITAYVSQEWSEINKTRTEKVTQAKFIAISKVSYNICKQFACHRLQGSIGKGDIRR